METRTLPSGIVTIARAANGDITITGDLNDNKLELDINDTDVSVTGFDRTRIRFNGQLHAAGEPVVIDEFEEATLLGALKVDMKDGDDLIEVNLNMSNAEVAGAVSVNLGDGDDRFRIDSFTSGAITFKADVTITALDGNDSIIVLGQESQALCDFVFEKNFVVDLGAGEDILGLGTEHEGDFGKRFFFDFGDFTDNSLGGLGAFTVKGDAKIMGGAGIDDIGIFHGATTVFEKTVLLDTGTQPDRLEWRVASSLTAKGMVKVDGKGGGDFLDLDFDGGTVLFETTLTINLDEGDDLLTLELGNTTVRGETIITGGGGYDDIDLANFGETTFQKSLNINAGADVGFIDLHSDESSLTSMTIVGDLKITTSTFSDSIFVGGNQLQIGGALSIITGAGRDLVHVEFGQNDSFGDEEVVTSVGKDVTIDTGNGSDDVAIRVNDVTNLKGLLNIKTGTQSDFVLVDSRNSLTIDRDVRIDSGNHSDTVFVLAHSSGPVLIQGLLDVNLGVEDDCALLSGADLGDSLNALNGIRVMGGVGEDVISLEAIETNLDVIVDGGNDNDTISIFDYHIGRDLIINAGAGDDDLQINHEDLLISTTGRDLRVDTGAGHDRMIAFVLDIAGNLDVKLGAGDDQVDIFEVFLGATSLFVKVDGGDGNDFRTEPNISRTNGEAPPTPSFLSITLDDPDIDQNGDEEPIEVRSEEIQQAINDAFEDCFADLLNIIDQT